MIEQRNTRQLILVEDTQTVGRALTEPTPRLRLEVPASGQSWITTPGGKCAHGVYIPGDVSGDAARDCTICRPYEIISKNEGYKA